MSNIKRTLLFSVWTLSGISLSSLIFTRELSFITTLSIFTLFPLFLYFEIRNRLVKFRWIENGLILIAFFASLFRLLVLKESFLMIVADFLIIFILLKLIFKKNQDDLLQIIALSFFLLLSASTLALDFTFLISFFLYIPASTWTLCLYSLSEMDENQPNRTAQTNFQGTTSESETLNDFYKPVMQNSFITLGLAILFAAGIFIFFPRLSLAVFQAAFLGPVHKSGFTDKVNLSKSGEIFLDPTVAMRVEIFPPSRKQDWPGYLRGQTLSYFDGQEWTAGEKKGILTIEDTYKSRILKIQKIVKNRFQLLRGEDEKYLKDEFLMHLSPESRLTQKIYLESVDTALLFCAPWVESVSVKVPKITLADDRSVWRSESFSGRISYEVQSIVDRPKENILVRKSTAKKGSSDTVLPYEILNNLQIPKISGTDFSQILRLTGKIITNKDSNYLKAKKIEKYLRENYSYTLLTKSQNATNPIEKFLFESKAGHCEYFASAMAVMLRLEGIPARIVTGFLAVEWNPTGNYYVVRSKDAHSWVEAYIGNTDDSPLSPYLWTDFDPSPRALTDEIRLTAWIKIKEKIDYWNFLWNAYVLGYDMESQKKLAKNVELKSARLSLVIDNKFREWHMKWRRKSWFGFGRKNEVVSSENSRMIETHNSRHLFLRILKFLSLGTVFILVVIAVIWKYRTRISTVWPRTKIAKNIRDCQFYYEMIRVLRMKGYLKKESETPLEFAHRIFIQNQSTSLNTASVDFCRNVLLITETFYKVRYSDVSMTTSMEIYLQASLQEIRDFIRNK